MHAAQPLSPSLVAAARVRFEAQPSAHFPIGAQWGPNARLHPHAPARFPPRWFGVMTCLFSPDIYSVRSAVRDEAWWSRTSARQACTYRFAEEKMRQVLGAPSCCSVVHGVYFGSRSFRRRVGLVVSHTQWGLGALTRVSQGQYYGYYSRAIW